MARRFTKTRSSLALLMAAAMVLSAAVPGQALTVSNSTSITIQKPIKIDPDISIQLANAAPSNVKVSCFPNSLSIRIDWQDNSLVETGYEIERTCNGKAARFNVEANVTRYDDTVEADTMYSYRVRALGNTNSSWSDAVIWSSYPAAPSDLTAKLSPTQTNYIDLEWKNNSKVNPSFIISKKWHNDKGEFTQNIKVAADMTKYTDHDVLDNTNYRYQIMAVTGGGQSKLSDTANLNVIPRPTDLKLACFPGTFKPSLQWKDNSSIETGFIVERAIEGQKTTSIFNVGADKTEFVDTVDPDTKYYYQVRAICNNGGSVNSNCVVWTSSPISPDNLQASAQGSLVKLTWVDKSKSETHFLISKKSSKEVSVIKVPANSTSYVDANVVPGTAYTYNIAAYNETSKTMSDYSANAAVTPLAAPTDLKILSVSSTSIKLVWKGTLPKDGYFLVQRKIPGGQYTDVGGCAGFVIEDKNLKPGTTYVYRIKAHSLNADSAYSKELTAKTIYKVNKTGFSGKPVVKKI